MGESIGEALQLHLGKKEYSGMAVRYHFAEADLGLLMQMGALTEQKISPVVYYEVLEEGERMAAVVSLGNGVDELQDGYMRRECLTEAYMIECICMELLKIAYGQAAERIHAHTGMWISEFEFLGDRQPLSCMGEIFRRLKPDGISYNQAYMLEPKKTVVFFANLCTERGSGDGQICGACGNLFCPNRGR